MFSPLETLPSLNALRSVWRSLGIENFDQLSSLFFQRQAEPGTGYSCSKCGCTHDITVFSPDDIVATCSCESLDCDPIALTAADIEIWELSWTKLARALCRALGLDPKIADLNLYQTWQIGSWSADAVPVILTIQNSEGGLRHVIAELAARLRRKFILLTPTNSNLDAVCHELLANAEAALFPLDNIITMSEAGKLDPTKPPAELFACLSVITQPAVISPPPSSEPKPRYAIRKGLGVWTIIFDGKEIVVKHEKGIFYVAWLLQHPGESIHALDLMAKIPEIYRKQLGLAELKDPATGKSITLESHARIQERNLGLDDAQAMRAMWKKQQELEAILDDESESEPIKAEALRELESIVEFQRRHGRRSQDSTERASRTVRQSIARFCESVSQATQTAGEPHPVLRPFAQHLNKFLLIPSGCRTRAFAAGSLAYEPPSGFLWQA
jgi:hypothetical protein